jgi:WD40 repeat protein
VWTRGTQGGPAAVRSSAPSSSSSRCSVAFCESEEHPWVASGATDGSVLLWDLNTFAVRHRLLHEDAVVKLAWVPAGSTTLVVATADGCVRVWDGRDGRCVVNHTGHAGIVLDFAAVPVSVGSGADSAAAHRPAVVTAGDDGVCRLYSLTPPDTPRAPAPGAAPSADSGAVVFGADAIAPVVAVSSSAPESSGSA